MNNTPKKILQGWKTGAEIDIVNTIEYDVKSYQVKATIVKYIKVLLRGLKFNCSHKYMLVYPTSMWRNKKNLNMKQSCKRFLVWIG